jgi:hypothetical protein
MAGEYIDKVEVGAKIQMMYIRREMDYGGENDFCRGMRKALRIIENMPTADVQPVKRGRWITKAENYYKAWQDSGRSWDYMPYFVTGKHIACSECFIEYDVCTEGIEHWTGCPCCLARMDGEQNENN